MVKVDIISGFLGAGKTTLIQKLLKTVYRNQNVVLIENEFGEIGIDGGFLKEAGIEIKEMNSGCICCSLVGDYSKSLKEAVETYHPERIIIEPSGVGKLSDVMRAVDGVKDEVDLEIGYRITVLDVNKCKMYLKNFGEFYVNQIEYASTIVFSRTDIAKEGKTDAALAIVKEHNADAAIVTTPVEQLNEESLLAALKLTSSLEEMLRRAEEEHEKELHHHDHDHVEEHHHHHEDGEECHCYDEDHDHEHHHHHDHDEHHHHHADGEECHCHDHDHEHHHHHHADDVFTSWGKETPHKFTREKIEEVLKTLSESEEYGMILRAKGMLPAEDGTWIYFDMVPEETEIREGAPEYTGRLCVIGSKLNEDKLAELFGL